MRVGALGSRVQGKNIALELPGLLFEITQHYPANSPRAMCLIGDKIIDVEPTTFIGVLDYAPQRNTAYLGTFGRDAHPRAVGENGMQTSSIIGR